MYDDEGRGIHTHLDSLGLGGGGHGGLRGVHCRLNRGVDNTRGRELGVGNRQGDRRHGGVDIYTGTNTHRMDAFHALRLTL